MRLHWLVAGSLAGCIHGPTWTPDGSCEVAAAPRDQDRACAARRTQGSRDAGGSSAGSVWGSVWDKCSGEPLPGGTVVADAPGLQGGERTALTDECGIYEIQDLPALRYGVSFYYGDVIVGRSAQVSAGQRTELSQALEPSHARGEI